MFKNIWFTSDWHLGHKNILKLSNRPFGTIESHDEYIINEYNKLVKNGDDVYFLGDLAWNQSYYNYKRIFQLLNGNIHFILGNHDNKRHLVRCQKEGLIVSVRESQVLNINNDTIHLTHYPLLEWYNFHNGGYALHGHTHGNIDDYCKSTDVALELWEYSVVSWSEIKDYIDRNCDKNVHPKYVYGDML